MDRREIFLDEILKKVNDNPDVQVYVLGAGMYAVHMTRILKWKGIESERICYVVQAERLGIPGKVEANKVIPLSKYYDSCADNDIMVAGSVDFCNRNKGRIKHLFNINYAWVNESIVRWSNDHVEENIQAFYETYSMLDDELSRRTMAAFISASLHGHLDELFGCVRKEQYFNEITKGIKVRTYIDCGAYDGDTISSFVGNYRDYNRIIAFEPDPMNISKLEDRLTKDNIRNVSIMKCGAYYCNGRLYFTSLENGDSSFIAERGEESIEVRTIDSLHIEDASLIKMDIEGSELDALHGARATIKKCRPALAICVYHRMDDLFRIPQYIRDVIKGEYRFYLRAHADHLTEIVFYAVPV